MRRQLLFLWLCHATAAKGITLPEAQSLAVKNSPRLQVLRADVSEAQAVQASIGYLGRPTLGLAAGGEFEATKDDSELLPLVFAYLNVALYDGRQVSLQQDIARLRAERSQLVLPFQEVSVRKSVEAVFLDLVYRRERRQMLERQSEFLNRLRGKAAQRRRAGLTGDADVLEFELRKTDLATDLEGIRLEDSRVFKGPIAASPR